MNTTRLGFLALTVAMLASLPAGWAGQAAWAREKKASLSNDALEADFQAGFLYKLKDRKSGKVLLSIDPEALPSTIPLFGPSGPLDLNGCKVTQEEKPSELEVLFKTSDGTEYHVHWKMESGAGDLILQASAKSPVPVEQMHVVLEGGDITRSQLVWVDGYGVGQVMRAPWSDMKLGDPRKHASNSQAFPLVALFEGDKEGWFIEGRDPTVGPANLMVAGQGESVVLGFTRRFPVPTETPEMYEIRIRTYHDHWENAVDPFITWLEQDGGYVPLDKKPQQWIKDIETQAYVGIGDFAELEALAARVDPKKTLVGRQAEFRYFAFDDKFPDYRVRPEAGEWFRKARELGFHVGAHFNCKSVSVAFPELVERFKPGFQITGTDASGPVYESIYEGPTKLYRVSGALKDWRDYFIEQVKDAVDNGVDIVYLDESMGTAGKSVIDGVHGLHGLQLMMQEIEEKYPGVAVETEQFNFHTAKHGEFALSQMPLGHPLSGYLFHRFVKVVPEGVMYSPTDNDMMDAFESWGFMLPGASPSREKSWMEIAEAYQKYNLVPDSRLPRVPFTTFKGHYSSGLLPVQTVPIPPEGIKLFGFRGDDGVTAYFEKQPDRRGLVIYEPGKEPQWIGTRHTGIKTYTGKGVPEFFSFRYTMKDWILYDDKSLLGLDPKMTYWFNEELTRPTDRFHVNQVPDDYVGVTDMNKRLPNQEVGPNDKFFVLRFRGNGEMKMSVPDEYDVYMNGEAVPVDRATKTARITCSNERNLREKTKGTGYVIGESVMQLPDTSDSSVLLAVRRSDVVLYGPWRSLPWMPSQDSAKAVGIRDHRDFATEVGGIARILGKFPEAKSIRLKGAYGMRNEGPGPSGDGVIRINGKKVARIAAGNRPYVSHDFDVDISAYAGKHVLVEFLSDGMPGRSSSAEWFDPKFEVQP